MTDGQGKQDPGTAAAISSRLSLAMALTAILVVTAGTKHFVAGLIGARAGALSRRQQRQPQLHQN